MVGDYFRSIYSIVKGNNKQIRWIVKISYPKFTGGVLHTKSYFYHAKPNGLPVRIKKTSNGVSTYYISPLFEVTGSDVIRYYYFNGQRVAMHNNSPSTNGVLTYLHTDHLGSTVMTTDTITNTNASGDQRY